MTLSASVRDEVLERAGHLCEGTRPNGDRCLKCGSLEIHHVILKKMGGRKGAMAKKIDEGSNLLLLCRSCHARAHGIKVVD